MRVIIIDTWGHEYTIEVGLKEPVLEIKMKLEQLLGIPPASQTLAVSEWELEDGLDMEDYPIVTEGTQINLTIKCMEPASNQSNKNCKIQIIVKSLTTQHQIEVFRTETVGSPKEKIHGIYGTPIKRMALLFSGMELEDFRKLSEYGICGFSGIAMILKTMNCLKDGSPSRRLSIVVQTSSSLLNSARIPLKMESSSTINDLRQLLLSSKSLPADSYTSKGSCTTIVASSGTVWKMGIMYMYLKELFIAVDINMIVFSGKPAKIKS